MEWREQAIVLGVRRLGESSVIAEIVTRERGRIQGVVRGGRSRAQRSVLQPGNTVEAVWRARLDEHLGTLTMEPTQQRAASLMETPLALHGVQLLAAHLRLLPERDAHPRLYDGLAAFLDGHTDAAFVGELVLRFEIALLEDLGFGLDLTCCALTGATAGLAYVSPRTGRAVTADAGEPWKDKLLPLPAMLTDTSSGTNGPDMPGDLRAGFDLTRHFLARDLWQPRGQEEPGARAAFLAALHRTATDPS